MKTQIAQLEAEALAAIAAAADATALEQVRIVYLSRNGKIPAVTEKLREVPKEEKPALGKLINELKDSVNAAFAAKKEAFGDRAENADLDTTLPGRVPPGGSLHPLFQIRDRAIEIFQRIGFSIADGPDIESEYNNFDALNTPKDHPARNEHDTFYIDERGLEPLRPAEQGRRLLRTQTSPVQIRAMLAQKPPIRVVCPGRCYRRDEIDATHLMSFFQIEGLCVDEGITLGDMKGTIEYFLRELLGQDLKFRFRPHFFPFTEPSFEVDCSRPGTLIRGKEWVELCGCGMVDPNVFKAVGYDSEKYTGWAFGFGIERIAMMVHNVPDLRLFMENDVRFLEQFTTG